MKNRNPLAVFFLPLVTFGIYALVWQVKTKNEMKSLGADIPTAWLIIVPIVNIWWLWKYSEGVDKVTEGKMSNVMAFVLLFLLGIIGAAIIQTEFNKLAAAPAGNPAAPGVPLNAAAATPTVGAPTPDNSFGGPTAPAPSAAPEAPTETPEAPKPPVPPTTPTQV